MLALTLVGLMTACSTALAEETPIGRRTHISLSDVELEDCSGGIIRATRFGDQAALDLDIVIPPARDGIDLSANLRLQDKQLDAGINLTAREVALTMSGLSSVARLYNGYLREGFASLGIPGDKLPRAIAPERLLGLTAMDGASLPRALLDHFAIVYSPLLAEQLWPWWISNPDQNTMEISIPAGSALPIVRDVISTLRYDVPLSRVLNALLWFEPLPLEGSFLSVISWPESYTLPEGITLTIKSADDVAIEASLSVAVLDISSGERMTVLAFICAREGESAISVSLQPHELLEDERVMSRIALAWMGDDRESTVTHTVGITNEDGENSVITMTHSLTGVYEEVEWPDDEADWIAEPEYASMAMIDGMWNESLNVVIDRQDKAGETRLAINAGYDGELWYDERGDTYERSGAARLLCGDLAYTASVAAVTRPDDHKLSRPLLADTYVHTDKEGAQAAGDQLKATAGALYNLMRAMGLFPVE